MSEVASPRVSSADPELLRQILADRQIEVQPYRPGLGDYFTHVTVRGWETVRDWAAAMLGGIFDFDLDGALNLIGILAALLFAALLVVLLVWLFRFFARGRVSALPSLPPLASVGPRPAAGLDWEAELELRLKAGDPRGSLEALWFFLASRLGGGDLQEPDAACTTRELLERAGRRDLRQPGQRLDRMLYADAQPQIAAIRGLADEFRQKFALALPNPGVKT